MNYTTTAAAVLAGMCAGVYMAISGELWPLFIAFCLFVMAALLDEMQRKERRGNHEAKRN